MITPKNDKIWQGRVDHESDPDYFRWHQAVQSAPSLTGLSLLAFASDEGVRRNQGRMGAKDAPDLIKGALANLPCHSDLQSSIYDAGSIVCVNGDLEKAHQELAEVTSDMIAKNKLHMNIGGGHETAYGSFMGLLDYVEKNDAGAKIGILNFDAHFDLREADEPSSGTPFNQMYQVMQSKDRPFNYCVFGISETANTRALFKRADELGVEYRYDRHVSLQHLADCKSQLENFIQRVDYLYVSIDMDVFSQAVAPGVSAPATRGIPVEEMEILIKEIVASGKLKLADICEYNPKFDRDDQTAKLAARLLFLLSK